MSEPKFKVGDKARVVGNSADHDFKVGDEIEIIKEGSWHRHSFYYRAKNNNGAKWDIYESDLSPIEEQTNKDFKFTVSKNEVINEYCNDTQSIYHDHNFVIALEKFAEWLKKKEKTMTSKDHSRLKEGEENVTPKLAYINPYNHGPVWDTNPANSEPKEQVSNWKEDIKTLLSYCGKIQPEHPDLLNLIHKVVQPLELQLRDADKKFRNLVQLRKVTNEAYEEEIKDLKYELGKANEDISNLTIIESSYKEKLEEVTKELKKDKQEIERLEDFIRHLENPKTRD